MDWLNAAGLRENLPRVGFDNIQSIRDGYPICVAYEKREGWTGELPCYIFWCPVCENFSYDQPHGVPEERYLACHRCEEKIDFRPWWVVFKMMFSSNTSLFRRRTG